MTKTERKGIGFLVFMYPEMLSGLPNTLQERLDGLIETVNAHTWAEGEHRLHVIITCVTVSFQKTRQHGMLDIPLRGECPGGPHQSVYAVSPAALQDMVGGLVGP